MTAINLKSFASFVQEQAANIQGRVKQLIDFSTGSVMRANVEANGGVGLWLQAQILRVLATTRAATSTGADLDSFVADFGLARLGAANAIGTVTLSRFTPSAQAVIPVGATVQTSDGTVNFAVIADNSNSNFNAGLNGYVLGAGIASIDVPVMAEVPGVQGNVAPGTIGFITTQIDFVDTVSNAAAIVGGGDAESDASLRTRFIDYVQSLRRGTPDAIKFAVMNLQLGTQALVVEFTNPDFTPNDNFNFVVVSTSALNPVPDTTLMNHAKDAVEAYRAGGIRYGVFPASVVSADVSMSLTLADGYDFQTMVAGVGLTLQGYVNGMKLGDTLRIARLIQIALDYSPGVISADDVRINNVQADLIVTARNIVRAGSVTVS
jgi:uncharacterized phage protein gp47/JayE